MIKNFVIFSVIFINNVLGDVETDYNEINSDGSFAFGLSNDDIGGHYHTATGSPNKIIRGRYGSRNPATGRIEETVYTAGSRGFRARGPTIHRRMDLSQYPRGPIGTPDDPLADPYDDPSYDFSFRTLDHERREEADSTGRVRGLYSYLDDIGERHTVRYAAGAETGFEVLNSVPDTPASVAYNSPLYKAPVKTRGRMSVQRGPDGQYRFILSGPDQRRSETSGADGVVRGSYSYLDDKGIQRTVQYIAGPGIGYRVVKNVIGPGTHVSAGAALPSSYGIRDFQGNDLADDGFLRTAESGPIRPKDDNLGALDRDKDRDTLPLGPTQRPFEGNRFRNRNRFRGEGEDRGVKPLGNDGRRISTSQGGSGRNFNEDEKGFDSSTGEGRGRIDVGEDGRNIKDNVSERKYGEGVSNLGGRDGVLGVRNRSRGNNEIYSRDRNYNGYANGYEYGKGIGYQDIDRGQDFSSRSYDDDFYRRKPGYVYDKDTGFDDGRDRGRIIPGSRGQRPNIQDELLVPTRDRNKIPANRNFGDRIPGDRKSPNDRRFGGGRNDLYDDNDYNSGFPLITSDRRLLEINRNRDWSARGRDSTLIKNVGKWYVNLPPGSSVRAHVQSIDLLPIGGRAVAPSEALLRDELKAT